VSRVATPKTIPRPNSPRPDRSSENKSLRIARHFSGGKRTTNATRPVGTTERARRFREHSLRNASFNRSPDVSRGTAPNPESLQGQYPPSKRIPSPDSQTENWRQKKRPHFWGHCSKRQKGGKSGKTLQGGVLSFRTAIRELSRTMGCDEGHC